jgi:predicted HTH domain antitoxin
MPARQGVTLKIPGDIILSLKIPKDKIQEELLKELSIILYERHILSLGKARELARMSKWEFQEELGKRKIPRHYTEKELKEDMKFARETCNQ